MAQILMLQSISRPWRAGEVGRMFEAGRRYSDSPVLGVSLGPVDATVLSTLVSQGFAVNDTSTVTTAPRDDSVNEFVRGPAPLGSLQPTLDPITGALTNPVTGDALVIGPIIIDTPANNLAGLQAQLDQFGYATLPRGTTTVASAPLIPTAGEIHGFGMGRSILKLADGANVPVLKNADMTNGNEYICLRDFTVDGNKANQIGDKTAAYGIRLEIVPSLTVQNIEVKNVDGIGFYAIGKASDPVENAWLTNIYVHHNNGRGGHVGQAFRGVHYKNITANYNGVDGWLFDTSNASLDGIYAYGNTQDGAYIRNVMGSQYNNMQAFNNGRHGIHAHGLVHCTGKSWMAHMNGRIGGAGRDVYMNGDSSFGYGVTNKTKIDGITVGGLNSPGGFTWSGGFDNTVSETHGLYIDDAVNGYVRLLNVSCDITGTSGFIRLPTSIGNLILTDVPGGTAVLRTYAGSHLVYQGYIDFTEISAPSAPAANRGRLHAVDVAGKTQLAARFNTGAVQSIVTEP